MSRLEDIIRTVTANEMREITVERVKQIAIEYAREVAIASLEKASKNAKMILKINNIEVPADYDFNKDELEVNPEDLVNAKLKIDKESITNPENITLL